MDQYSWHVLPLCRINSNGENQPLTASVHTAFLRHCMKIDGFDIISKASLSHMPAMEGTGWDQLVPFTLAIAVMEWAVVHHCMYLLISHLNGVYWQLLIFTITFSYTDTLSRSMENVSHPVAVRAVVHNTPGLIKVDKYKKTHCTDINQSV